MRNLTIFLTIVLLLTSCGGLGEAGKVLRNEKITNTDEFLVKKNRRINVYPIIEDWRDFGEDVKNLKVY